MSKARSAPTDRRRKRTEAPSYGALLNRTTALPIAIAAWAAAVAGDYATPPEVRLTLLYLVPVGIAVWWRGIGLGLLFAALSTVSFVGRLISAEAKAQFWIVSWNLVGSTAVLTVFALVLHRLRGRLVGEINERESAVVQLRHADRLNTVGKLASGIAHELGTPLNVVGGRASLIASGRITGDAARKSAEIIVQQVERMTDIIKNLLAFARRGGTRKASLDLNRLARETVGLLEPLAKKSGVHFVIESGEPHIAPVNAGEIQQVMTNLIMNAIQAMPNGGTIRVKLAQGPLERGGGATPEGAVESYAQIRVRDEGIGIPPDVEPHIFDPFFTTKEVGSGTGLGLSVTFGIVRDHGGTIELSTEVGKGSEFAVFLPQFDV